MGTHFKRVRPLVALAAGLSISLFVSGCGDSQKTEEPATETVVVDEVSPDVPVETAVADAPPMLARGVLAGMQAPSGETHVITEGMSIQEAVKAAKPGDIIEVHPGTYHETVYIDKDSITMTGVIEKGAWPTLDGKKDLNDAFLYSGDNITIQNFKIINYKGNGIMGQAGNNFLLRHNWIIDAGVYGIFPEFGKNGIVSHNIVTGIADAAIYVGMSDNIDVLYNEVYGNVAGIEFENTRHGLAEGNYVYDNAGGILAFISQGLPIKTSEDTVIRNNFIVNNNHVNFAIPGSVVSAVPSGSGILMMAADGVVIEGNIISGNQAFGVGIIDFYASEAGHVDKGADPTPDGTVILNNLMHNNGFNPSSKFADALAAAGAIANPDIVKLGTGSGCIYQGDVYRSFGIDDFTACDPAAVTTASVYTKTLPEPAPGFTIEASTQEGYERIVGERAYYAVCSGCHAVGNHLVGPPIEEIQAAYEDDPEAVVAYVKAPYQVREGYPEMPPQDYMTDETLMAVAKYVLAIKE